MTRQSILVLAALLSTSAFASSAEDYVTSQPVRSALLAAVAPWDKKLTPPNVVCGADTSIASVTPVGAFTPFTVDAKGVVTQGAWLTRVDRKRCGVKTYTAVCQVKGGQAPVCGVFAPGTTQADPLLVRDAFPVAAVAAVAKLDRQQRLACADSPLLEDTKALQVPAKSATASWSEEWTYRVCGESTTVKVNFSSDGKGGTHFEAMP